MFRHTKKKLAETMQKLFSRRYTDYASSKNIPM